MKIIHFINSLATGGAETLVAALAQEQISSGDQVSIVTLNAADGVPKELTFFNHIDVVNLNFSPYSLSCWRLLKTLFSNADVVHVHLFPCLFIASLVRTPTPFIYTEHSTTNRRRNLFWFRPIDRFSYMRMHSITAVSEAAGASLRDYLRKISLRKQVVVIHNGIASHFFEGNHQKLTGDKFKLLSVGTFDARKNFRVAINAVQNIPEATLTIVGDGPKKQELQSQICALRLDERIEVLGRTNRVKELMLQFDALLVSSTHEGFSLVALEAMATGLPVIAPDLDGLNEIVIHRKTGLLSPVNEGSLGLEESIVTLMNNRSLYSKLSKSSKILARNYSISATALKYRNIYSELISM